MSENGKEKSNDAVEQQLADLLAASGDGESNVATPLPEELRHALSPELQDQFHRARACLHLVKSARPRNVDSPTPVPFGLKADALVDEVLQGIRFSCFRGDPPAVPDKSREGAAPPWFHPDYEVREEIGRGGMGVVFLARQQSLNRPVALKLLREGVLADPDRRERFRREAEVMARLNHPNIVQVHEVGECEGRPYLVCEYVPGGSLDRRLQGKPLPAAAAAALIETLARAMYAAHQAGIIHRDLKPANILLAGARGQKSGLSSEGTIVSDSSSLTPDPWLLTPKITDFGLAKNLVEEENYTRSGVIVGTPSYMAPEQARAKGDAIGPTADVYALGAILYELLTGRPPFVGVTPMDTLYQVVHVEPVPPRRFQPKLPRDLETICQKCLDKDPAKRFDSAWELAEDLRRFQKSEPIKARPTPWWERGWKWARRRPAVAALYTVASVAVLVLLGTWVGFTRELGSERDRAESRRVEAVKNYRRARAAVDKFLSEMADDDELVNEGLDPTRKRLLESALEFYQQFVAENQDDPDLQVDLADASYRLGSICRSGFSMMDADRHFESARVQYTRLVEAQPAVAANRLGLAKTYRMLGYASRQQARYSEAENHLKRALALFEELDREAPNRIEGRGDVGYTSFHLAWVYLDLRQWSPGEAAYRRAMEIYEELVQRPAARPRDRVILGNICHQLSHLYQRSKEPTKYLAMAERALALRSELVAEYPEVRAYQGALNMSLSTMGNIHLAAGKHAAAEDFFARAVEVSGRIAQTHPTNIRNLVVHSGSLLRLAKLYERTERRTQALPLVQRALGVSEKIMSLQPAVEDHQTSLISVLQALLAAARTDAGQLREVEAVVRRLLKDQERYPQELHADSSFIVYVASLEAVLADVFLQQKRYADAVAWSARSLQTLAPALARDFRDARVLARWLYRRRGEFFMETQQYQAALTEWERGIEISEGQDRGIRRRQRALTLAHLGDHVRATEEAAELAGVPKPTSIALFDVARIYAEAATAAARDSKLTAQERESLVKGYTARALVELNRAHAAGFFGRSGNSQRLQTATELKPLRSLPEFQELNKRIQTAIARPAL